MTRYHVIAFVVGVIVGLCLCGSRRSASTGRVRLAGGTTTAPTVTSAPTTTRLATTTTTLAAPRYGSAGTSSASVTNRPLRSTEELI